MPSAIAQRPTEGPPILPPGVETLLELKGQWWVGHTKARFEKAFGWDLLHLKIPYFLPLIERVKISRGRKYKVRAPLFTSYVFFCGGELDRYAALKTDRLCQVIPIVDQDKLKNELLALEKALAGNIDIDPYPFAAVGKRCRVTAGALMGMEGIVIERKDRARIVLSVSILGQGASVEIDNDLLEPAE